MFLLYIVRYLEWPPSCEVSKDWKSFKCILEREKFSEGDFGEGSETRKQQDLFHFPRKPLWSWGGGQGAATAGSGHTGVRGARGRGKGKRVLHAWRWAGRVVRGGARPGTRESAEGVSGQGGGDWLLSIS